MTGAPSNKDFFLAVHQCAARINEIGLKTSERFAGNLLAERQKIQPAGGVSTYNLDRAYTYDTRMRLTGVSATLNGGPTASQTVTYDALQRPASVSRGNSAAETTTFSYTLQGWLSSATSTSWLENLYYASPAHGATSAAPGKAGLVTEWKQQQLNGSGATTAETFAYTYDLAGRLKNSVRYLGTATSSYSRLTEGDIGYDLNGNLTGLTRYNESGTAIQTLSYSYNGPKRTNTGWAYDNHGNLTADPQGSMSIAWNAIGFPRTLTASGASTQQSYLSDGSLAQVAIKSAFCAFCVATCRCFRLKWTVFGGRSPHRMHQWPICWRPVFNDTGTGGRKKPKDCPLGS